MEPHDTLVNLHIAQLVIASAGRLALAVIAVTVVRKRVRRGWGLIAAAGFIFAIKIPVAAWLSWRTVSRAAGQGVDAMLQAQVDQAWIDVVDGAVSTTIFVMLLSGGILRIIDSAMPRARLVRSGSPWSSMSEDAKASLESQGR